MSTPRGMARGGGEDGFEEEDPDASLGGGGGGGGGWGELALAGPSGLQQTSDANQPEPERIGIADYMTAVTPDPYVCSVCYVVFPSATLLAEHQTTHEAALIDSDTAVR